MTLANKLTLSRIALIPPVMVCLAVPSRAWHVAAAVIFSVAAITDYFDGYLSRSRNETSNLGKLLDPLADKLLVAAVFIGLVEIDRAPGWIVTIIIGRELLVTGLRAMAAAEGLVVAADTLGKWKMVAQIVAALALMLDLHPLGELALWAALVLTLWSGWAYVHKYWFLFRDTRR